MRNLLNSNSRTKKFYFGLVSLVLLFTFFVTYYLRPLKDDPLQKIFTIAPKESFKEIITRLKSDKLIRSTAATKIFAVVSGSAHQLKPGTYELSPHLNGAEIIRALVKGAEDIEVTLREGLSVYEVDRLLSEQKIIQEGALITLNDQIAIEGKLFPDTYRFFKGSQIEAVAEVFLKNFERRLTPILNQDPSRFSQNLVLASLIEEEVPDFEDRKLVAGIFKKRLASDFPLQVDATVCYTKLILSRGSKNCLPLAPLDLKIDSPYNTYQHRGLPPGPIASPGVSAVQAVLTPEKSPYWFYLSDQKTGKTIFAKTLEEHNQNITIYLKP